MCCVRYTSKHCSFVCFVPFTCVCVVSFSDFLCSEMECYKFPEITASHLVRRLVIYCWHRQTHTAHGYVHPQCFSFSMLIHLIHCFDKQSRPRQVHSTFINHANELCFGVCVYLVPSTHNSPYWVEFPPFQTLWWNVCSLSLHTYKNSSSLFAKIQAYPYTHTDWSKLYFVDFHLIYLEQLSPNKTQQSCTLSFSLTLHISLWL